MQQPRTKIVFVTSRYPPMTGGAATRISNLSRGMMREGCSVTILTYQPFPPRLRLYEWVGGVRVLRLPCVLPKNPLDQILPVLFISLMLYLRGAIIVSSLPAGEPSIGVILASRLLSKPCVLDVRDEWEIDMMWRGRRLKRIQYSFYWKLFNALYRKAHLIVTVTPRIAESMRRRSVDRIHIIPNGVNTALFHPRTRHHQFTVVYAGIPASYYRTDLLREAQRRMKTIQFIILEGSHTLEETAQALGSAHVGIIPYDDDPLWDATVPLKFYEYCASGLPVIAMTHTLSELAKMIEPNGLGLTVPPTDLGRLIQAVTTIYENRQFWAERTESIRRYVLESFDAEVLAKRYLECLNLSSHPA